jgi:hypothetical protein
MCVNHFFDINKIQLDRKETEEVGLFFTAEKGSGERYSLDGQEISGIKAILNTAWAGRCNAAAASQTVWRERYSYDANGNRSVNYGLAIMSAGAMIFVDGIHGVKSDPLEKITNVLNPNITVGEKSFVPPF